MRIHGVVLLAAIMVSVAAARAADFTAYFIGNSLSGDLQYHGRSMFDNYQASLTPPNTFHYGAHFRPATPLKYLYHNPLDPLNKTASGIGLTASQGLPRGGINPAPWSTALPGNRWDVVIIQSHGNGNGAGYENTLGDDTTAFNGIIAATRTNPANQNTRFFIYATWSGLKYDPEPVTATHPSNDNTKYMAWFTDSTMTDVDSQKSELNRAYTHYLYERVHKANPGIAVSLLPTGEVFYALAQKMERGEFDAEPGEGKVRLRSIDQLHRDGIHLNFVGQDIVAWMTYAVVFGKTPVGLPPGPDKLRNGIGGKFTDVLTTSLSAHDVTLIQQTVWEVVKQQRAYTNVSAP